MLRLLVVLLITIEFAIAASLKIGLSVPATGQHSEVALAIEHGIETFLNRFNMVGGLVVNGSTWDVDMVVYNDGGDPETAAIIYRHLVEVDQVHILLSPYEPPVHTQAIADIVEAAGIPLINFGDVYYAIDHPLNVEWIYTTRPDIDGADRDCFQIAFEHEATTVAIGIGNDLADYQRLLRPVVDSFNFTIVAEDVLNGTNAEEIGAKWAALKPDVIFGGNLFADNALLLDTFIRKGGGKGLQAVIFFDGVNFPAFIEAAKWQATNTLAPDFWFSGIGLEDPNFSDRFFPPTATAQDSSAAFAELFASLYGEKAQSIHALAAHAVEVAVLAFNASQSLDPFALRSALDNMNVTTLLGLTNFDSQFHWVGQGGAHCLQYQKVSDEGDHELHIVGEDNPSRLVLWPATPLINKPKCWPNERCPKSKALKIGLSVGFGSVALMALIAGVITLLVKAKYHLVFVGKQEMKDSCTYC